MNEQIEKIRKNIEPLRQEIMNHKVYSVINDLDDLRIFMKYHTRRSAFRNTSSVCRVGFYVVIKSTAK